MARIYTSGAELNSAASGVEVDTVTGAGATISTTAAHTGTYSFKAAPTLTTATFLVKLFTVAQTTIGYFRFYINVATVPVATVNIITVQNAGGTSEARVSLTATGRLQLNQAGNTAVGSNSAILNTGQWYRVELKVDATTNPGALELQLDGVSVASGANNIQGSWARVTFGVNNGTASPVIYFDDIAINDSTGLSQNGYPGAGSVVLMHPNAQGDANDWAVNVGGTAGVANNYTRVNEVPPDDATSYNASITLNNSDLFKNNASGISSTSTITAVCIGVRFADLTTADATTGIKLQVEKAAAGTISKSANLVPNSTAWITNGALVGAYPFVLYNDPDGNAWTQSTIDTMQIGYIVDATGVNTIAVSNVWAYVDYVAGVAVTATGSTLALLGVG